MIEYVSEKVTNKGENTDLLGNVISWSHEADSGLITFSCADDEITTWCYEDDPEDAVTDFMKNWNKTQIITLNSIKLNSDVAEFVLKCECDGSYSQEDVDMVSNELKHVETHLKNLATLIEKT